MYESGDDEDDENLALIRQSARALGFAREPPSTSKAERPPGFHGRVIPHRRRDAFKVFPEGLVTGRHDPEGAPATALARQACAPAPAFMQN